MTWRYEIKYLIEPEQWFQLQQVINFHPSGFRTAFADRLVNNIYYDTPDFTTCNDNIAGISERRKFRLRWYGNAKQITDPVFEIKIKNNALGRKENYKIKDWDEFGNISNHQIPFQLESQGLIPVLQNQYLRSYYVNLEQKFRLTVDRKIRYQKAYDRPMTDWDYSLEDDRIVVEIKFDAKDFALKDEITSFMPFRNSKHSKYVTGILMCY